MSQVSEQDFLPYLLDYLPGSFEEGFYAGKNAGIVDSASQQASQRRVARGQGQPDQTPYYIVFSKNKTAYIAIVNNVPNGTAYQNFNRVAEDIRQAHALSEYARQAQSGEVHPGQGGGRRRHRKGRKSHRKSSRKSSRKSHRRHL